MFWAAIGFVVAGIVTFAAGWVLNTRTPIQQPLPGLGVVLFLIGCVLLLIKLGMVL